MSDESTRGVSARGTVAKILPFSAVDGPGNRAVVFLQGCDFDCRYCHNPETRALCIHCGACVPACPSGALSSSPCDPSELSGPSAPKPFGLTVSWDPTKCSGCGACVAACPHDSSPKAVSMGAGDVMAALSPYRAFISGITVSGGECGLQADFLEALLRASRAAGLPGLVDTNGSTDYSRLPGLVVEAEGFMLDVKAWDDEQHRALTGASNLSVLDNLRFFAGAGKLYEARTVVAPGLFNAEETVLQTARVIVAADSNARYKLIRYRPQGVRVAYRDIPTPGDDIMDALAAIARGAGVRDVVIV